MRTLMDWMFGRPDQSMAQPPSLAPAPVVTPGEPTKSPSKYRGFSVEHYPLTGVYFPKKGAMYLKRRHTTGIYELEKPEYFMYADNSRSESGAWAMIDLYIEQMHKENVKVITRD